MALMKIAGYGFVLLLVGLAACTGIGPATSLFKPSSPHEQYSQSLKDAKLDRTALGTDWLRAGERALGDSLTITVPYRESGYFSASKPLATGYKLKGERGDRFLIKVETVGTQDAQVFIDVFSLDEQGKTSLVTASKADTNVLNWEPRRNQNYLIRVQPELLRSGQYTISITREPALSFPVQGKDSRQISSYFGVPRDGGRRKHEGIDIFAPKGTPALASANGIVSGVGLNRLGGNVAFVNDAERRIRIYYAHLDSWHVKDGQRVAVGDTIGFVGNTGNARTTAPHLHYGIYTYDEGATNPLPFIRLGRGPAKQPMLATSRLGDSVRVIDARTAIRTGPSSEARSLQTLPKGTVLTIAGGTDFWLRVVTPTGATGYVANKAMESIRRPLRQVALATQKPLLDNADPTAAPVSLLAAGSQLAVLGVFGAFELVRQANGTTGWVSAQ
ncbi:SH3 domain-containing protein [Spirosoma oryzae]|uniref:SH3 domain-containing protein n=1 Tax=Spirosoma oryzae TaxID=1469603 RepID=A0A2T0S727_9BACT|nr:SH3 domain-containing protein [Spirosoma oryzae]